MIFNIWSFGNPRYNTVRGPVTVADLRFHVDFQPLADGDSCRRIVQYHFCTVCSVIGNSLKASPTPPPQRGERLLRSWNSSAKPWVINVCFIHSIHHIVHDQNSIAKFGISVHKEFRVRRILTLKNAIKEGACTMVRSEAGSRLRPGARPSTHNVISANARRSAQI